MPAVADLLDELRRVVGGAHVVTDPAVVASFARDWTGRFVGSTHAVVRPGSVEEVAAVVAACDAAGVAVVPQGGNTGLVGGGVPLHGELVVSLRRLDRITDLDVSAGAVTAGAGVTIAALRAHVAGSGWDYGVDLGTRESATVGGTIATNAGGLHALRHGPTRRQLLGYEAVLADGRLLRRSSGVEKDSTGYDLGGLLCGSEGTLAVVTAARLRLVPLAPSVVVALLGFDSTRGALAAASTLRREVRSITAVELFFASGLGLVCERLGLAHPFESSHAAYVLVEAAGAADPSEELATVVGGLDDVVDVAVASEAGRRRALWRYREGHTEAINTLGAPHKLDVGLPIHALESFLAEVGSRVARAAPGARVWLFGHAAEGNVHVNVTGVDPDDESVSDAVLTFAAELGGSISAEHGIGAAKRRFVHLTRSAAEIEVMRAIKRALDPRDTLNPHVLLP